MPRRAARRFGSRRPAREQPALAQLVARGLEIGGEELAPELDALGVDRGVAERGHRSEPLSRAGRETLGVGGADSRCGARGRARAARRRGRVRARVDGEVGAHPGVPGTASLAATSRRPGVLRGDDVMGGRPLARAAAARDQLRGRRCSRRSARSGTGVRSAGDRTRPRCTRRVPPRRLRSRDLRGRTDP